MRFGDSVELGRECVLTRPASEARSLSPRGTPPARSGGRTRTAAERRKHPIMDPELLGAIVQAVRIGFVVILIALLLYLIGIR